MRNTDLTARDCIVSRMYPRSFRIRGMQGFSGKMGTTGGDKTRAQEWGFKGGLRDGHRCVRTWMESRKRINRTYPCRLHLYSAGTAAFARSIRGVLAEVSPLPPARAFLADLLCSPFPRHEISYLVTIRASTARLTFESLLTLQIHFSYFHLAISIDGERISPDQTVRRVSCGDGGRLG